ncbi:MAG: hypothetical protein QY306_01490 [Anaerolineales bacterium]|nr:MAG: hypothetical protein QY306_01490 [Anaerolineales bacterium]
MNTFLITQRKEEAALDADVPLARPTLIPSRVSEMRLVPIRMECVNSPDVGLPRGV